MSAATGAFRMRGAAWGEARALAWRYRRMLGAGFALVVVNRVSALAVPFASRTLVDEVLVGGRGGLLLPITAAAAFGVATQCASGYAISQIAGIGAQRAITAIRGTLQAHLVRLPVAFFDHSHTGALVARVMSDTEQLRGIVGGSMAQLASGTMGGAIAVVVLITLDAQLTMAIVVVLALFAAGATRGFRWLNDAYHTASVRGAELAAQLTEVFGGIHVVKACAAERRESLEFLRGARGLQRATCRGITGVSVLMTAATFTSGVVSLLILVVGGGAVLAGTMTPGDLVMYAFLAGLLSAPLLQMAAVSGEVGKALAALARIRELRDMETELAIDAARGTRAVPRLEGHVEFACVSYAYQPTAPLVLRDVSFMSPAGSTTALVGRSGSGKSTICRLLLAFTEPIRGQVLVDGCDLALLRRSDYRRQLGVVLQEGFLFDASVAENIRYARPGATQREVRAAARAAHCAGFIDALPRGYDTVVGERGVRLSGGQRQRLAIARAILADPRILILDEATSNLDTESEALIQDALRTLTRGRTTFVVAHRLSTVTRADQIVVLEAGRVVERGTHGDLFARGTTYRRLYERQRAAGVVTESIDRTPGLWTRCVQTNGRMASVEEVRGGQ